MKKWWLGLGVLGWLSGAVAQTAPLEVASPWVRATVAQQTATGLFMTLRAHEAVTVLGARSSAAGRVEVHEMVQDGAIMRMRARQELALAAGQTLALQPGGWHLMLLDLTAPLTPGQTVPVILTLQSATAGRYELPLSVPVQAITYAPSASHTGHH